MNKKKDTSNPDVVVGPDGSMRLTLSIDKINVEYTGNVTVSGVEATYDERRKASYSSDDSFQRLVSHPTDPVRFVMTIPMAQAKGYGIGSVIVVTVGPVKS